ncbi:hypothetical protein AX279_18380 [Pseudomonas sp. J237]|nr:MULTISPECIES: hypothetical protein [Pseudomonas]OEO24634.1 hypothetical protein AX279_18380 [Pseudomonas sp. J237]
MERPITGIEFARNEFANPVAGVLGQLRGGADHIFIRRGTVAVIAQIQLPGDVLALQGLPLILDIQFPSEGVTHAAFISAHLIRLPIRGVGSAQGFNIWIQELPMANRCGVLHQDMPSTQSTNWL